ncbi:MAG TPA: hypothetical protein VMF30_01450 [Pirellulales bacterium]|nr:hypothetical protein [Pirellulales bacterium]
MPGIRVDVKNRRTPAGWAVGNCPHCGQVEAIQIDDVTQVTSIYWIPVYRRPLGQECCCDFCRRPVDPAEVAKPVIDRPLWSPPEGLPQLVEKMGGESGLAAPPTTDRRLRSLLDAVESEASLMRVDLGPGATWGAVLGAPVGLLLSLLAFEVGLAVKGIDRFGTGMFGLMTGGVVGLVASSVAYFRRARNKLARQRLATACENYGLDRARLADLATEFNSEVVRRAAATCRDEQR